MVKDEARKVEMLDPSVLVPYENNARTHSDEQISKICRSIEEFGFVNPVLIDNQNMIIAGHGRVMAAKKLGLKAVPCLKVEGLTETQVRAYILADNKLAEDAGWDMNLLGYELGGLQSDDFDITVTGFEMPELDADQFGTDFELPSGDKSELRQMTFTLHNEQAEAVENALHEVGQCRETFGNENKNGNSLYEVIAEWDELRKL